MFDRYTDRLKRVLELAREGAARTGHSEIGAEHLLLGLLRADSGTSGGALRDLGVRLDVARREVAEFVSGPGD